MFDKALNTPLQSAVKTSQRPLIDFMRHWQGVNTLRKPTNELFKMTSGFLLENVGTQN